MREKGARRIAVVIFIMMRGVVRRRAAVVVGSLLTGVGVGGPILGLVALTYPANKDRLELALIPHQPVEVLLARELVPKILVVEQ
mgnify:FL=1